jgi:hypothetical protein
MSWTKHVEGGTCVSILRRMTWTTIKKMDGGETKVPIRVFH